MAGGMAGCEGGVGIRILVRGGGGTGWRNLGDWGGSGVEARSGNEAEKLKQYNIYQDQLLCISFTLMHNSGHICVFSSLVLHKNAVKYHVHSEFNTDSISPVKAKN